jgi:putative membrane protein
MMFMTPQPNDQPAQLDTSTALGYERTRLAHERTFMAWIRTSISLISFGFTIYKVFQSLADEGVLHSKMRILSPRVIGVTMIMLGLIALAVAMFDNHRYLQELQKHSTVRRSFASIMAGVILVLGILSILAAVFDI